MVQFLVEDHCVMWGDAVWIESKPWDSSSVGPAESPIQVLRYATPLCVQRQEAKSGVPRHVLDGAHQLSTQARTAAAAMHQQLCNLRAMRLVRRPGWVELDSPNNPFGITDYEEDGARVGCNDGLSPPVLSALKRERCKKTHRCPGLDRVDQKLRESSKIGVTHRRNRSFNHGCF